MSSARLNCPRGSAVAWDTYLRAPVEVCEPGEYPGTIVCRRIDPVGINCDGVMMPLPVWHFQARTRLARELLRVARTELPGGR